MTLICLPGLGNTPALFDKIAADVPLTALSMADAGVQTFADQRAHVAVQLSAFTGRPITLLGYSMGGYLALSLTLDPPPGLRIERLALVNTRAVDDDAGEAADRERTLRLLSDGRVRYEGVGPALFKRLVGPGARADADMANFVREMALAVGPEGLMAQIRALQSRPDYRPRLGEIRQPTLIVAGEVDQRTPLAQSQYMADAIPGAQLEVLEGCGHIAPLERPGELAALLKGFVA